MPTSDRPDHKNVLINAGLLKARKTQNENVNTHNLNPPGMWLSKKRAVGILAKILGILDTELKLFKSYLLYHI